MPGAKFDPRQITADPEVRLYAPKYDATITLSDGTAVRIRPIRPEDEPLIATFHESLSEQSVYRRYFMPLSLESRTRHERLTRICFIDYDHEMALVAEQLVSAGKSQIVGVARLIKDVSASEAELAVVVSDAFQRRGIGSSLTKHLIEFGRDEGICVITAWVLFENRPMQKLLEKFGFVIDVYTVGDGALKATLRL